MGRCIIQAMTKESHVEKQSDSITVTFRLGRDKVEKLKSEARRLAFRYKTDMSYLDLIRQAIDQKLENI